MKFRTKLKNPKPKINFRFGCLFSSTWGDSKMYITERYFEEELFRYSYYGSDKKNNIILYRLNDMEKDLPKGFSPYMFIEIY